MLAKPTRDAPAPQPPSSVPETPVEARFGVTCDTDVPPRRRVVPGMGGALREGRAVGVSLCFSSSCEGLRRWVGGPVGLPVSEHGEQDVDSAPGEADECGVVFLAVGSFRS